MRICIKYKHKNLELYVLYKIRIMDDNDDRGEEGAAFSLTLTPTGIR